MRRVFMFVGVVLLAYWASAQARPNVLMISVDDMNDWTSLHGGYASKVHTPNLDRLAKLSMNFTNAHTASPVCCPSRTALLLGRRPSSTGIYNNGQWWRPHLPNAVSLPMCFRQNGYRAFGAGKVFHHTAGFNPPDQWDDFQRLTFRDDPWFRGHRLNYPWSKPTPNPKGQPLFQKCRIVQADFPALDVLPPRIFLVKCPRPFLDEQHFIVQHIECALQSIFQRVHHGKNGRYHEDAHHDPKQGQEGPKPVGHDRGPSEGKTFKKQAKPKHGTKLIPTSQVRVYVRV